MFDALLDFGRNAASVVNAMSVGVLQKAGLLPEASLSHSERLESEGDFNTLMLPGEAPARVCFRVNIDAMADLRGFLDPTDAERFLTWRIVEGSSLDLPGLATSAAIQGGHVRLVLSRCLEYYFEFFGDRGDEGSGGMQSYYYKGAKDIRRLNRVRAWTVLKGGIYELSTGRRVLDSVLFSSPRSAPANLAAFLKSIRIK